MLEGINVIIVDNDPEVSEVISNTVKRFYVWGEDLVFTDVEEATAYCRNQESGVAIF
ncbi:hypothetical protein ACFL7M_09080 [Thermodesulfobacteriota bacterium]